MDARDELPLLDEVAELLEKEKTLLNLQLLERDVEAQEWKAKYEDLVNKVVLENEGNLVAYEAAADVEASELWKHNFDACLHQFSSANTNFLIIDRLSLSKAQLKRVARVLATSSATMLRLTRCELSEDTSDDVCALLTKQAFEALDFSNNDLGPNFFSKLLQTFRHHHRSPQYLCLDGNLPLSQINADTLIAHLTPHTWGLSLTLADLTTPVLQRSSKPPAHCVAFLKQLNHHLATPHISKQLAANSLHRISVLCLRNAQMSKESIKLLEITVGQLIVASLVDLDLSFTYIGYAGAQMLSRVVASPVCNIVRLSASGCYFGDSETTILANGLKKNKSLVYVSLHGNHVSNSGIGVLGDILPSLRLMQRIIVSNNWCDVSTVREANIMAQREGALGRLIWNKDDVPKGCSTIIPLYAHSKKVSGIVDNAYGYTTLYSIPSKAIRLPSDPIDLHLHWTMHPCDEDMILEVVTEHSQGCPVVSREHIPALRGYAVCDVVVPPLPMGCTMHVRCYVKGGVRVSSYDLSISEYKKEEPCVLYMDSTSISPVMLRIAHSNGMSRLPDDFIFTRQYTHYAPSAIEPIQLVWESKLTALVALNSAKEPISTWKKAGGMLLGYQWCVFTCRFGENEWMVVSSGEVLPVTSEGPQELLSPWLWSPLHADVPMIQRGDKLALGFKIVNNRDVDHQCEVLAKNFQVTVPGDIFEGSEAHGAAKKYQQSFPPIVHLNYAIEDTHMLKYLV